MKKMPVKLYSCQSDRHEKSGSVIFACNDLTQNWIGWRYDLKFRMEDKISSTHGTLTS